MWIFILGRYSRFERHTKIIEIIYYNLIIKLRRQRGGGSFLEEVFVTKFKEKFSI